MWADSPADAFLQRWRTQDPAFRQVEIYDRQARLAPALGLYFELAEMLYRLSERRLAEGKLAWWLDEAQATAAGQASHPLTQALQLQGRGAAVPALVEAIASAFEAPTPVDRQALVDNRQRLLQALAATLADGSAPAVLAGLDDCFRLASLGQGGDDLVWPLSLAERARQPDSAVQAATAAALVEWRRSLAADWLPSVDLHLASAPLAVQVGLWRDALCRHGRPPAAGLLLAWKAWRLARRARGPGR